MRTVSPSSPRLVWHGRDGRIELSGRVFDNWVAKSSNLLVDELDATSATTVAVDLPVHWKTLALVFACWQVGAVVEVPEESVRVSASSAFGQDDHEDDAADSSFGPADIILSSRARADVAPPRLLVCVALGSLALGWDGPLPRGAVNFAAEVRSHGDMFLDTAGNAATGEHADLVRVAGRMLKVQDLARLVALPMGQEATAAGAHGAPERANRVAEPANGNGAAGPKGSGGPAGDGETGETDGADGGPTGDGEANGTLDEPRTLLVEPDVGLLRILAAALEVWQRDGTLVLVEEGVPITDRMLVGERVTDRLGAA